MNELPEEFKGLDTAAQLAAVEDNCIICDHEANTVARFAHLPEILLCAEDAKNQFDNLTEKGWAFSPKVA